MTDVHINAFGKNKKDLRVNINRGAAMLLKFASSGWDYAQLPCYGIPRHFIYIDL